MEGEEEEGEEGWDAGALTPTPCVPGLLALGGFVWSLCSLSISPTPPFCTAIQAWRRGAGGMCARLQLCLAHPALPLSPSALPTSPEEGQADAGSSLTTDFGTGCRRQDMCTIPLNGFPRSTYLFQVSIGDLKTAARKTTRYLRIFLRAPATSNSGCICCHGF